MLAETDFVGILGVCVVRVDGLRPVGVLGGLGHLRAILSSTTSIRSTGSRTGTAEAGRLGGVALGSRGTAGVARHGGGGLKAAQLGRGVHLGGVGGGHRLGPGTEGAGHRAAASVRAGLLLVEGKRIDESTVRGLGSGTEIEDPDDLGIISKRYFV